MSGIPEPVAISEIRKSILREADIEDRLLQITAETAKLSKEKKSLIDELSCLRKTRWEAMQRMDLTSSQNYGHEGRMNAFLMELLKPVAKEGQP